RQGTARARVKSNNPFLRSHSDRTANCTGVYMCWFFTVSYLSAGRLGELILYPTVSVATRKAGDYRCRSDRVHRRSTYGMLSDIGTELSKTSHDPPGSQYFD